tara:strand:+ start:353 stop:1261 length:909 start_codon:yes stop_codon:yes gene_type:complete
MNTLLKENKLPNLLIAGAQKSATTFFNLWLSKHSDIFSEPKECKLFENPEYDKFNIELLKKDLQEKYYVIRRADWFSNIIYQKRLYKHLPNAKIIIILRNPIQRSISAYYHYMGYGITPPKSPDFIKSLISGQYPKSIGAYKNILDYGLYYKHLSSLYNSFDAKRIKIIKNDLLFKNNADDILKEIFSFLELDYQKLGKPENKYQSSVYNYRLHKFRLAYYRQKYFYDKNRTKSYSIPYKDFSTFKKIFSKIYWKIDYYILSRILNEDHINTEIIDILKDYYREDVKKLQTMVDFNVSDWMK